MVTARGSSKTRVASENATLCFERLLLAFRGSHWNVTNQCMHTCLYGQPEAYYVGEEGPISDTGMRTAGS